MNGNEKFLGYKRNWGTDFKSAPAGITLSDEKIPVDVNNDFIADYYKADIVSVQDYYPFGMYEPQRNFNASTYRYGFNGMLKDDEVKGSGNSINFGARILDTRLGRWLSVDPLAEKHSDFSPYAYTFNNPIVYTDPDGRDGVKIVDKKNKTITVKADYYVQTESAGNMAYNSRQITSMQKNINKTLNESKFTVSDGKYEGYKVKFDLQFKKGGESWKLDKQAKNAVFKDVNIGNTFQKGNSKTAPHLFTPETKDGITTVSGGVTDHHKKIMMNAEYDTKRNRIHEVFHTLFFDNDDAKNGIGSYSKPDLPNQNDIDMLINNEELPSVSK